MADSDDKKTANPTPNPAAEGAKDGGDKMTMKQWLGNYVGLGFFGNTAVAVGTVNLIKKATPKLYDKMVGHYEKKFIKRQEAKLLTPVQDKLSEEAVATLREHIKVEARELAEKTLDTRLLSVGGFAMAPLQSAKEVMDYDKNRRKSAEEQGIDPDSLGEKPKFNPLGPEASSNMPKWIVGRVVALGAAFAAQNVVDGKFGKQKDAVDHALAKIITRIVRPKGQQAPALAEGASALEQEAAAKQQSEAGIDQKILKNVRIVTSDAYMTAVAISTHNFSNKQWSSVVPKISDKLGGGKIGIDKLREHFSGNGQGKGAS